MLTLYDSYSGGHSPGRSNSIPDTNNLEEGPHLLAVVSFARISQKDPRIGNWKICYRVSLAVAYSLRWA